ncbi:MAG: SPOR domain-containing protein [Gammaproteobacteria bacterium]|nr:SPOR domain-containing protein [Gammaproteobacteria bacterium]
MIKRNFNRNKLAALREDGSSQRFNRRSIILLVVLIAVLGSIFVGYYWRHKLLQKQTVTHYITQLSPAWLEKNTRPAIRPPVQIVANTPSKEVIEFEFYDALPAVNLVETEFKVPIKPATVIVAAQPAPKKNKPVERIILAQHQFKSQPISNALDLEKELAHHLKQKPYILQLGLFRQHQKAISYRNTLAASGLNALIVKVKIGKDEHFRLQQGPFITVSHAKSAQQKLQQRGINALVRQA